MELIVPDILADARQLSGALLVGGLTAGTVLWMAGWWSHRFWMVMGFTVMGGIWGLQHADQVASPPFVAALGIGLAAGILALTLVRLGAFIAGGYAGLAIMHAAFPNWDQPLLSFLLGAFLGFALLRYWMMALTSLAGVVLMAHTILALLDRAGKLDCVKWSEINSGILTTLCGSVALSGFVVQFVVDWRRRGKDGGDKDFKKESKKSKSDPMEYLTMWRRAG